MMRYRIGMVSEMLGISAEGLRLYERNGILDAQRGGASGKYRSYSLLDITALIRARTYHNYGFSLQETEKLINGDDTGMVRELYCNRQREIKEELKRKRLLADYMDETLTLIDSISQSLNNITVATRPGMYRFEYARENKVFIKPEAYKKFQAWVNLTPIAFAALRNEWEALCRGEDVSISAMGITEEFAGQFGIKEDENVKYYPPCKCLYTVVKLVGEKAKANEYLSPLVDYVYSNDINVCGDAIARTFVSLNKRNNYTRYRQIWLPIE